MSSSWLVRTEDRAQLPNQIDQSPDNRTQLLQHNTTEQKSAYGQFMHDSMYVARCTDATIGHCAGPQMYRTNRYPLDNKHTINSIYITTANDKRCSLMATVN